MKFKVTREDIYKNVDIYSRFGNWPNFIELEGEPVERTITVRLPKIEEVDLNVLFDKPDISILILGRAFNALVKRINMLS